MDAGLVGHTPATAPIEVACWDLSGKAVGMPVCRAARREPRDEAVADLVGVRRDPEDMRPVAYTARRWYLGHSIKIGDKSALDAARIEVSLADRRPREIFLVDAKAR